MDMSMFEPTPEEQQRILAAALRGREMLSAADKRANKFNNLAAISQMANNQAAAAAAAAAMKSAQARHTPIRMGNQGFVLNTGDFVESPMNMQERMDTRAQQRGMQQERLDQQAALQAERLEAQRRLQQERLDAQSALRMTIAAMKADNDELRKSTARSKDLDRNVQNFSRNLEKAGVPLFAEAMDIVQETLSKYKEGELPGYGRIQGGVPNFMATTEMQTVRTNMQQAANILLKARSGAAVTDSEMRRFLTEVAQGAGMSEDAMRNGWANVARTFGGQIQNLYGGFDEDTRNEYFARGGRDLSGMIPKPKAPAPAPAVRQPRSLSEARAMGAKIRELP